MLNPSPVPTKYNYRLLRMQLEPSGISLDDVYSSWLEARAAKIVIGAHTSYPLPDDPK